jgi:opacity protein-like surface antigen
MKWTSSKHSVFLALLTTSAFASQSSQTFYELDKAASFQSDKKGIYYIELGDFANKKNAYQLEKNVQSHVHRPVAINNNNGHYMVIVGPMHSAEDVRKTANTLISMKKSSKTVALKQSVLPNNHVPTSQKTSLIPTTNILDLKAMKPGHWFIAGGIGAQEPNMTSIMTVKNGSTYAVPYNSDQFSTRSSTEALLSAEAGYYWQRDAKYLPSYALSAYYNHLFTSNIGRQITQYSITNFQNYNYNWDVSSDVVLALAKLNLVQYRQFSPFFNVGIGAAFNHASNYNETALPGIVPRISPAFSNNTSSSFAYNLGAGIDWQICPQLIVSLAYEFEDLGSVSSRYGATTWSQDTLRSATYQTNMALLKINYLIA